MVVKDDETSSMEKIEREMSFCMSRHIHIYITVIGNQLLKSIISDDWFAKAFLQNPLILV